MTASDAAGSLRAKGEIVPIDYFIDHKRRLVVVKAQGVVEVEVSDIFGYEKRFKALSEVTTYSVLVDMSGIDGREASAEDGRS